MLPKYLQRWRRVLVFALHLVLIPIAYRLAFAARFDFNTPPDMVQVFWQTLPIVLTLRLASYAGFGLFSGWWRHVGMADLADLIKATTLTSLLIPIALFFGKQIHFLPRSILLLDWAAAILIFGGVRFAVRAFREDRFIPWRRAVGKRTLILGAGDAAERLLREIQRWPNTGIAPLALLDDDPAKAGSRIHGVQVVGTIQQLPDMAARFGAEQIVIAIPSAGREEMRQIVTACIATELEFRIVPPMNELLDGRIRVNELRRVEVADLLGRETIELDLDPIRNDLHGKRVLITGGAGSIGSELARQIAAFRPEQLVLLDHAETPLHYVMLELQETFPELAIVPAVGSVTDEARLLSVFRQYAPQYVFHAAAYKHVPMMELNPIEAVRTNVIGTLLLAQCAAQHNAEKFVLISTDKAVYPSSVMGATKRIAERLVLGSTALQESDTDFRAVRFGNVLGSNGSVIPTFEQQLAKGGPLTVTHPDVTRYFMTIPEAVQLVLRAAALPEAARRISMLDMGEPVRILDVAENLIRLSGLEPYTDIKIIFTGLRPGEKLREELTGTLEAAIPTAVSKIRIVQTDDADPAVLARGMDRLFAALSAENPDLLRAALTLLVPECVAPLADYRAHVQESEPPARLVSSTPDRRRIAGQQVQIPG